MKKTSNILSKLTMIALLGALLGGNTVYGDNSNAAKGKDQHRTWSVYLPSDPAPVGYLEFRVGDAFRLSTKDTGGATKFKLLPLRKLEERWGSIKFVDFADAGDKDLLCGQVKIKKDPDGNDEGPWLAIDTTEDNVITLGWVKDESECHSKHSHPGHAKAEN